MKDKSDDEDVVLGLALGSKNYPIRTRLNGNSGAGVNANSRVDMAFAASDPLSELVWSPHSGLSLKCTDSSLGDNKPFILRNVEPSVKDLLTSPSSRLKRSRDDKVVDEVKLTISETMLDGDTKFGNKDTLVMSSRGGSSRELEESCGYCDAGKMEEDGTKNNGDGDLSGLQNVQIADVAESSKRNAEQGVLADGTHDSKINTAINQEFSRKPSEALSNLQSRPEPADEVTSPSGDMNKNKITLMKLESSAENDFEHLAAKEDCYGDKTRFPRETSLPVNYCPTNSRVCLYRDKGKGKALFDGDIHGRSSDDKEDSHESVESCNSAGLFSKGIERRSYDQEQLVGSKRMKRQIQGSTSTVRPDSSFMKWILNMVKGLSDSNKDESSSLTLTLARSNDGCGNNDRETIVCNKKDDCESPIMGFQTLFQSLYRRNTKMSEVLKDNCSKELTVTEKKSLENLPQSCDKNFSNSCMQIVLSNKEVDTHLSKNVPRLCERTSVESKASDILVCNRAKDEVSPSDSLHKQVNSSVEHTSPSKPEKSNPHASLWITRLYTRTARLENYNRISEEACECSTGRPNANLDRQTTDVFSIDQKGSEARDDSAEDQVHVSEQHASKSTGKLSRPSDKLRNSEAMESIFEKRLDALRHITHPLGKRKSSMCTLMCFFCGGSGHDLHNCLKLTETELEDLLVKISSFDGVEDNHRLCIRCFQFNHWAVSCPLGSEQNLQLCADDDKPRLGYSRERLSTLYEYKRSSASTSETDLKDKQNFPLCNFGNSIAQEKMFRAIRKLRLSRCDILRWMDSNVSLSHLDGFFLRLRLGKLEAEFEGTRYYVAYITGGMMENNGSNSKKCILVDVGGIKSPVGTQYVSNHDFQEDEIKAWWSRILQTGGKIPSLHELNSKLEDKRYLGF